MKKNYMFAGFVRYVLCVMVWVVVCPPAHAQQGVLGIAAIVNDEVISAYDVSTRVRLVAGTSGLPLNAETIRKLEPQVLDQLIDEKLKLQYAAKHGVEVSQAEVEKAVELVEKNNNVPPGQLANIVRRLGLDIAVLHDQIRPEVVWLRVGQTRLKRDIIVGEDEVTEKLSFIGENMGKTQMRVSEIYLPVRSVMQKKEIFELANKIVEAVRGGSDFSALARQFSQSPSAARGGDLEWVAEGQLESELDRVLVEMEQGEISEPVSTRDGIYILKLASRIDARQFSTSSFKLSQIFVPDSRGAEYFNQVMQKIKTGMDSCAEFNALAEALGTPSSGSLGTMELSKMPTPIQAVVADLQKSQISEPVQVDGGKAILMVCDRMRPENPLPEKEAVRQQLEAHRLQLRAARVVRDLRRKATIEIRR